MLLGVESSCDESALAWFDPEKGIVGEWVHSQIALHQPFGGIVPDIASREHLEYFPQLLTAAMEAKPDILVSGIAVTSGPGLAGSLAMGMALAQALSLAWNVPVTGVNHLRGHAFSPFIQLHRQSPAEFEESFRAHLPHLGLIVSGGNTLLFSIGADRRLRIEAQTVDDAAGEALDKGARLLGMPYPGGPLMERNAEGGDPAKYDFPRAFPQRSEARFSFSGLKTSLRYRIEKMSDVELESEMKHLCAGYQEAVAAALERKTGQLLGDGGWKSLGLSGGVANNQRLRTGFAALAAKSKVPLFVAEPRHTGDNAAMIAFASWLDVEGAADASGQALELKPSWPLVEAQQV